MRKSILGFATFVAVLFGAAGVASAQSVQQDVTNMATNAFGQAVPIVLAVAGAAVALSVALYGARLVLRAIKGGGRV